MRPFSAILPKTSICLASNSGKELSWTYDHPDLAFSRQVLTSAYLSTKDHQALLLQAALSTLTMMRPSTSFWRWKTAV